MAPSQTQKQMSHTRAFGIANKLRSFQISYQFFKTVFIFTLSNRKINNAFCYNKHSYIFSNYENKYPL